MRPRHDPTSTAAPRSRRRCLVALVTACVVAARGHRRRRRGRPSPRIRRSTPAARGSSRGRSPIRSGLGTTVHVLRARLRARRRDVAVRRPRSRARRPDARRRSSPTTTGARPSARSRRPRRSASASCPAGRPRRRRRCSSTAGWRPGRSTASAAIFPADAALRLIPTTTSTATGPTTTWRLRITAASGAVLHDAPKPASVVVRSAAGRRPAPAVVEAEHVRPVPGRPADHRLGDDPDRQRRQRACRSRPTCAASSRSRCRRPGRRRRSRPRPSRRARMPPGACARASRTTTSTDDTSSQVYHGALGEKATTNAAHRRDGGRRPAQPQRRDRQHAVPLDRRRRDREQRERLRLGDRREGRGPGRATCAARAIAPRRQRLRRGVPVRDVGHAGPTPRRSCRPGSPPTPRTERRDADGPRPARPRRLGPAHQRDPHRQRRARRRCRATSSGRSSTRSARRPTR